MGVPRLIYAISFCLIAGLMVPAAADYERGVTASQMLDYATALKEFRKSAEQGHAKAQFELGLMYERGQGVPRNPAEAARWYRKAAAQGLDIAKKPLARVERETKRETISFGVNALWMMQGETKQLPNNCGEFTSSIKPDETPENWTELFSLGNFKKSCTFRSVEERYNAKKQYQEKTCPGSNEWKILEKDTSSLIFEHKTTGCQKWPDQIRIGRILDGKWNRWELEYNVRGDKIKKYRQVDWLLTFAAARIVP